MRALALLVFAFATFAPTPSSAHGGGLDANGCHTNRKTGEYHCHRGPGAQQGGNNLLAPSAPRQPSGGSTYYRNCSEARAAGAAPVRAGDPGYGRHLDRDGDGVGCE
jgi:hypothetical protein